MNRMKEFRARARIHQKELAELSGVSVSSIAKYETEMLVPTITTLQKIVRGFAKVGVNVTSDEIYPIEGE